LKNNFEENQSTIYRFCQGNNDVISELLFQEYTELYFTAFRFTQNEMDAEDIVSDCFEKLMKISNARRSKIFIENKIELKSYLLVMVKHKSLDFKKTAKNRNSILSSISDFWQRKEENENLLSSKCEHIMVGLDFLNDREKQIMSLSIEGYSIDEIRKELSISKKTVSNILSNARTKLKLYIGT
jgi:RNA polymerase sigma factor (sigma-70 family)